MRERRSDAALEHLFVHEDRPCPEGAALLRVFAETRPSDFAFLKSGDFGDLSNPAFSGIPEWEAFAAHYGSCRCCRA